VGTVDVNDGQAEFTFDLDEPLAPDFRIGTGVAGDH
jgi:hypothetical protein